MEQRKTEQPASKMAPGTRFGNLTVLEEAPRRNGRRYWLCRCACGTERVVDGGHLRSGHTKSCGCLTRRHPDLTAGMKFGQLTLIEQLPSKDGLKRWLCQCDCGNECTVFDGHLKSGHTKSCGCLSRRYPDLAIGMKLGQLTLMEKLPRNAETQFWRCLCDCGNECTVFDGHLKSSHTQSCGCRAIALNRSRTTELSGQRFGRLTVLERAIDLAKNILVWKCRCDCGREIFCQAEHLTSGHTKSCGCLRDDQRKENMKNAIHFVDGTCIEKIACQRETAANTSGHRGVHPLRNGRFRAALTFRNKRYDLGTHATFEEAVAARLKAEQRYYGEFLESYYAAQKAGEA